MNMPIQYAVFFYSCKNDNFQMKYCDIFLFEPRCEKTGLRVSDHVRHKPGCTITEYGYGLENLDLESRGIGLSMKRKQRR